MSEPTPSVEPPPAETPAEAPPAAPAQAGSAPGSTATATCFICGEPLRPPLRYCIRCERYQPIQDKDAAFSTKACRVCGEQILGGARRCKHCDSYQRGPRAWLPVSSDTIALLAALLSTAALVGTSVLTVFNFLRGPRSETTVAYSQRSDGDTLVVRATNLGSEPSHLTRAFLQLRAKCKLRRESQLCTDPPRNGPSLVLEPEQGRINPGDTLVKLPRVAFPEDQLPAGVADCAESTWDGTLKGLNVCVEVSLRERQERKEHCHSFQLPASSPSIRAFVEKATRCPTPGT